MYEKVREAVKSSIRDEAEYVRTLMDAAREPGASGDVYLVSTVGQTTANRIMEIMPNGQMIDKITTYDEYLESDEMARKRQTYSTTAEEEEDD